MTSCQFLNPLSEPQWNEWVSEFPDSSVFHTAQWARVIAECYGYSLHYAVFKQGAEVVGIIPIAEVRSILTGRRAVSLPFSDTCAPLLREPQLLSQVLAPLATYGKERRWDYLELRGGSASELQDAVASDVFFVHDLDMEGTEAQQFARLRDSHRRNILKARKSPIESKTLYSLDAMRAYYKLHCITRRRHGLPPQPRRFFDLVQQILLEPKHGFVQLVGYQGKWIAGAVFLQFSTRSTYKFGASDLTFQHLRPNNLLMWDAIEELRRRGSRRLSFGRTAVGDTGLLQFKRGWGAVESSVAYSRIGLGKKISAPSPYAEKAAMTARDIARRLPVSLLRVIGSVAYRHIG